MRILLLSVLLFWGLSFVNAQELATYRSTDWSQAGTKMPDVSGANVYDVLQLGAFSNGEYSNDSLLNNILGSIPANDSAVIFFPSGKYLFNAPLYLPGYIRLCGAGSDSTSLIFDLNSENHAIMVMGNRSHEEHLLSSAAYMHDRKVICNQSHLYQAGEYIQILDNDDDLVSSSWALNSTGQIARISLIQEDTLFLESALRRTFRSTDSARIFKIDPVQQVSIENLLIQRKDATTSPTANIYFDYSVNCRVKCISSYSCNYSHIKMNNSAFNTVSGSHFQDAFSYGNGGKAYGIMLQRATSECLITGNSFKHLRHAMILQAGANGNVFSYNYSTQPYWTGVSLPSNSAGDLVLHGNYPYLNLFEGNVVQNIVIDDSHGENGKFNTFYRNRAELYGIVMNYSTPSDSQNFVGNEITNTGLLYGNYYLTGNGHFEFANNHKGTIKPTNTQQLNSSSYYLDSAPLFYNWHSSWPPIGPPNSLSQFMTETEYRIIQQGRNTQCSPDSTLSIRDTYTPEIRIYPNPCSDVLYIDTDLSYTIRIYDVSGRQILEAVNNSINVSRLNEGIYFIRLLSDHHQLHSSFIKTN